MSGMAPTRMGSIPGHTFADLAFNFVMLDALKELAGRLRDEGLIESVEWYPEQDRSELRAASLSG